jgi:hypothetical protein
MSAPLSSRLSDAADKIVMGGTIFSDQVHGLLIEAAEATEASSSQPSPEQIIAERAAELARALSGPAARLVGEMRLEQILKFGHDAENDSMLPIDRLPWLARERMVRAMDLIRATGEGRNLAVARKDLARAAAMCLAAIDRLDLAMRLEDEA